MLKKHLNRCQRKKIQSHDNKLKTTSNSYSYTIKKKTEQHEHYQPFG